MKKLSQYFLIIFFLTSCFSFFVGIKEVTAIGPCSTDGTCSGGEICVNNVCQTIPTNDPNVPFSGASDIPTSGVLKNVKCVGSAGAPCGLCDFIQVFVNISDMILAASGVVGFLLFIYAGILYLLVPYKPDYVNKAKTMITAVIIGLVIVFGAYTIVSFTLKTIGYDGPWSVCKEATPTKPKVNTAPVPVPSPDDPVAKEYNDSLIANNFGTATVLCDAWCDGFDSSYTSQVLLTDNSNPAQQKFSCSCY